MPEQRVLPSIPIQTREEAIASLAAHDALLEARKTEKKVTELANIIEESSLEDLRRARVNELKAKASKMQEWRTKGHGYYTEVSDQKQWFEVTKSSERVITHFYRPTTPLCETVDSHLTAIAAKHVETKFVKINAEKSPFLSERLQVVTLPTIIMTTKGAVKDTIVGFEGIAKLDKCSSDDFERRLAMNGMIDYEGDPRQAKDASRRGPMNVIRKSTLAKRSYDGDSSDGESD